MACLLVLVSLFTLFNIFARSLSLCDLKTFATIDHYTDEEVCCVTETALVFVLKRFPISLLHLSMCIRSFCEQGPPCTVRLQSHWSFSSSPCFSLCVLCC